MATPPPPVLQGRGWGAWGSGLDHTGPWVIWAPLCPVGSPQTKTGVPHPQSHHNPFGLNRPGIGGNLSPVSGASGKLRDGITSRSVTDMNEPDKEVAMSWLSTALYGLQGTLRLISRQHMLTGNNSAWQLWGRRVAKAQSRPPLAHCLSPCLSALPPLYT